MPTAVYREYRWTLLLFQAFGLAPFGKGSNQNNLLQLVSLFSLLLALFIMATLILLPCFVPQTGLQMVVGRLLFVAEILTLLIVVVQSYASRQKQAKILQNLDTVWELLSTSGFLVKNRARSNMKHLTKTWLLVATMIGTIVVEAVFLWFCFRAYFTTYVLQMVYPTFVNRIRCVQNVFYVDLMREQLVCVAQRLQAMTADVPMSQPNDDKQIMLYPDGATWLRLNQRRNNELLALKLAYGKLWDTSCLINECFGWSLLAIITEYFIHLTTHGYWLFLTLNDLVNATQLIESVTDIATVLCILIVLCQSCYASGKQVV